MNRDLTRRVRNINGITQHKQIVRNDIKLAAKLIHTLDDRTQLWASEPGTPPLPTVSDSRETSPEAAHTMSSAVGTSGLVCSVNPLFSAYLGSMSSFH